MTPSPCPGCLSVDGHGFFRQTSMPVLSNLLCKTAQEAQGVPRGDLELALCQACGLIFNAAFDEKRLQYGSAYENALHFSGTFRAYMAELADELVSRHALHGKTVVELGCGDGAFLVEICQKGQNQGMGFDPSHEAGRAVIPEGVKVAIVPKRYDEAMRVRADFVAFRHVLEHVYEPLPFVAMTHRLLSEGGGVYCEVPDTQRILEDAGIWDIIYEHCLYFTPSALYQVFVSAGFAPLAVTRRFGQQFLSMEAAKAPGGSNRMSPPLPTPLELQPQVQAFARKHRAIVDHWKSWLKARRGQSIVVWGAGSKGSTFLNTLDPDATAISAVVDQNPRKHGHFTVGTGHEIVGPGDLLARPPRCVLVMNSIYRQEIRESLVKLGIDAEVVALGEEGIA